VTRRDREPEVVEVVGADGHVDTLVYGSSARFERAGVEGGLDTLALRRGSGVSTTASVRNSAKMVPPAVSLGWPKSSAW